jgi:hypothetical protein
LYYTVRGDTLVAGAGGHRFYLIPSVYETEFGTLNFTLIQKFGKYVSLNFQAKNLTNPPIQSVYRGSTIEDTVKTSYFKGIDLSISINVKMDF